jgi:hypothetical protein
MTNPPSKQEWAFTEFPSERRGYLELDPPFEKIAQQIADEAVCEFAEPDPLREISTNASKRTWRAWNGENSMVRIAVLGLSLIVVGVEAGCAQDIAGIEDCTKTSGLDKRTGCLQSNVNFLQRLVTKNALDARHKLDDAASEIVALKGVVTSLQKTVEQLQAAQKAAGDKKPESTDLEKP